MLLLPNSWPQSSVNLGSPLWERSLIMEGTIRTCLMCHVSHTNAVIGHAPLIPLSRILFWYHIGDCNSFDVSCSDFNKPIVNQFINLSTSGVDDASVGNANFTWPKLYFCQTYQSRILCSIFYLFVWSVYGKIKQTTLDYIIFFLLWRPSLWWPLLGLLSWCFIYK